MTMRFDEVFQNSAAWLPIVDALFKVTVLLAFAGGVALLLRRSSAASRHLVWACALVAALAVPVLSLALPRWELPLVTLSPTSVPRDAAAASSTAVSERMTLEMRGRLGKDSKVAPTPDGEHLVSSVSRVTWAQVFLGVWLAGTVLILLRLALGILAVHWMSRRTEIVGNAPWVPLAREIASQLNLSRVTFRRNPHRSMPMAWGVFRPSVVMPADADAWPQDRVRVVLLHELAHIRRADCLTHVLAQIACALYWMNPLAWIAARRLRTERERACDDLVLSFGTAGPDYADQLLEIARSMNRTHLSGVIAGASLAMARPSQLEGRLMSILDPSVPRTGISQVRTTVATIAALAVVLPLASVQPWTRASAAVLPAAPQPAPEVQAEKHDRQTDVQSSVQASVQAAVQGSIQGAVEGAIQGSVQGVIEGQNPNPKPNPRVSAQARSKADPKVVAALTEALKDSDKEVRESAMHALVQLRDPGMFEPLVQALKDPSADVRESAAFGLGQLHDKRAVAPLSSAVKDASPSVREQAVFALGQLNDPSSVDAIAPALRDESASVREQAAFALGRIRDDRAIQPLMAALKDSNPSVREQAAFALGHLDARQAVDVLIAAMKDGEANVREQAAFALGRIGDERAVDALTAALKDSNTEVRRQAAFALGQLAR